MNILASWKWLNELVDLSGLTADEVAARVSLSGPGVEKILPLGDAFEKIVVGRIEMVEPHPQADRLRVTTVNVGKQNVRIVCGGSNVEVGQVVPVALIGARVKWHGEGDLIELKPIEIRGVASEGMICAASEIGLAEAFSHGEKEILDLGKALPEQAWTVGQPLAEALGIAGEMLLDSEVTTNRPDAMGMHGFAREVAAILGRRLQLPEPPTLVDGKETLPVTLSGEREGKPLCARFCAVKMSGVRMKPSPWWLKQRLIAAGLRPVNVIVDITNYILLERAQPMHAYDAAKLDGGFSVAPLSRAQDFLALDGKTYHLEPGMLCVQDAHGPVAIAGIMGGAESAVSETTTSVVFEAATFEEVAIRRTSRALELMTDASKLFEKGLSTEAPLSALARAVELCRELTGGEVTSIVADERVDLYVPKTFSVREDEARSLMGIEMDGAEMEPILKRLGFTTRRNSGLLTAVVPWWRDHDIEDGRDLVEEIARLFGYANMQPVYPAGMSPVPSDSSFAFASRVREMSKGFGLTEMMSYSFVSREQLERCYLNPVSNLRLQNPLTQDHEFMRPSLAPSMLQAIVDNQERAKEIRFFEIANTYQSKPNQLPEERAEFFAVVATHQAEPWAQAKGLAEAYLQELGIEGGTWERWSDEMFWHPGRSLRYVLEGKTLFTVGELHPRMMESWKIEPRVGMLHAMMEVFQTFARGTKRYQPIPTFPEIERDLAMIVDEKVEIADVEKTMHEAEQKNLLKQVTWFDTFRGEALGKGKKSLAFHLVFRAEERTLASEEVDAAIKTIREALIDRLGIAFRE